MIFLPLIYMIFSQKWLYCQLFYIISKNVLPQIWYPNQDPAFFDREKRSRGPKNYFGDGEATFH